MLLSSVHNALQPSLKLSGIITGVTLGHWHVNIVATEVDLGDWDNEELFNRLATV